mmetsp:Transcript_15091/g.16363  ORF Transcript_15091/g.16363 Transcript_15091/m.16363 type:complete len:350 (+) Transcript_15091:105-1154(+)
MNARDLNENGIFNNEIGGKIDLEQLNLGDEFKVGPMSFMDVISITQNSLATYFHQQIKDVEAFLEELRKGKTSAIIIAALTFLLGSWLTYLILYQLFSSPPRRRKKTKEEEENEEPIVLRDFTIEQLREFDGEGEKKIYVGLCGEIFDVSDARGYYGPGASYHCFAGRNATRAMAKYCFDEAELNNPNTSDLGPFERHMLNDWYQKYKYYKCYPVVGKYSYPPKDLQLTKEELAKYNGRPSEEIKPAEDRIDAPIYIAVNGKIFDVSYGGKEMYGEGSPYNKFAGKDATRALAKMSLDEADVNSSDLSDLTEEQKKTLNQWEEKFLNNKKYPVVGTLVESTTTPVTASE